MTPTWVSACGSASLYEGDCRAVLRELPEGEFDSCVTDPPYELGFMGKRWDASGVAFQPATWGEVLRVLKPGAYMLAFGGTRTYHRLTCAIEDAGFEIRDCIMWVYGSGFPKGKGCLKPAWEPIILARRPGGKIQPLQIDACRVETDGPTARPPLSTNKHAGYCRPWNEDPEARASVEARRLEAHDKRDELGRWPANLIHDGSEEVCACFPNAPSRGFYTGSQEKPGTPKQLFGNTMGVNDRNNTHAGETGSAARFFYCAKASKRDRDEGLAGMPEVECGTMDDDAYQWRDDVPNGRSTSKPKRRNHHPTVKPTELMRYLVRLITPPRGTVIDPFTGSGSTGKACALEGLRFVGIDNEADYLPICGARIQHALSMDRQLELIA